MMASEIYTLPDDFGVRINDTLIYYYNTTQTSVNNKVVFTKNMIALLRNGIKEVQTAAGKVTITKKDVLMLTAGSVLMSETITKNKQYNAILVFFGNQTLTDFCSRQKWIAHQPTASGIHVQKIPNDAFLENYCESLLLLQAQKNTAIDELKIQELLGYISIKYPKQFNALVVQAMAGNTDIKFKQVVELNANKRLTVKELAFLCHMSVSTFKRHFEDLYKISPQKYYTRLKMEQAKTWLSLQKKPTEIYTELGYENLSAFSNEFKKYVGVSPKVYQTKNELPAKASERSA